MDPFQELLVHLDGCDHPAAEQRLVWYGQLRAKGESHDDALRHTVDYFDLHSRDWYQLRMAHLCEEVRGQVEREARPRSRRPRHAPLPAWPT